MGLLAFGNDDKFECADFDDWWASLPPDWRSGRLDAHREWNKRRPDAKLRFQMKQAVFFQSKTEKWQAGYRTTPAKWIRGGHEEDYVKPEQSFSVRLPGCEHADPCRNRGWCQELVSRERRGEA